MRTLILNTSLVATLSGLSAIMTMGAWTSAGAQTPGPESVHLTIDDKGCKPLELTVPPTKISFKIKNISRRGVEWEILKGNKVIDERENIVPGFISTLTTKLDPGEYQMTCGHDSNPKGKLTVKAATKS